MSCWVIVPAAGIGRRMRSEIPKQYLPLDGYTVLEHSLTRLSVMPAVREIIVALAPDDPYWPKHRFERVAKPIRAVEGGKERSDSVINALHALTTCAKPDDWVLVHDAARPCVRISDIQKLLDECQSDPVGGLLAVPVRDTMKQAGIDGRVAHTVAREYLWHALTPQMFRFGKLVQALTQAQANKIPVTDEAMAMELAGMQARLVEGHADNIKITRPEDLTLAAFYLREQSEQGVPYYYDGMEDGG
ncbi:MAG: 2-C-methyl-D-erythritol 4-phosphate cytidylyltransferase [Gammaproteobacteria bacterium]|nr:2-C-methyl-D-erythritol 4-phosphate cytidylyltransferase [Gammaproteobacteria bacterium]